MNHLGTKPKTVFRDILISYKEVSLILFIFSLTPNYELCCLFSINKKLKLKHCLWYYLDKMYHLLWWIQFS